MCCHCTVTAESLFIVRCPVCEASTEPMPFRDADQRAAVHDDIHHHGTPTADLHRVA